MTNQWWLTIDGCNCLAAWLVMFACFVGAGRGWFLLTSGLLAWRVWERVWRYLWWVGPVRAGVCGGVLSWNHGCCSASCQGDHGLSADGMGRTRPISVGHQMLLVPALAVAALPCLGPAKDSSPVLMLPPSDCARHYTPKIGHWGPRADKRKQFPQNFLCTHRRNEASDRKRT